MRLTAIHLKSFRSAVDLTIPCAARRVLIAGKNHAGKSTVREAIRWGLTNRCGVTDAKGVGADLLIPRRNGSTAASVVLEVADLGGVSRSYGPGSKVFSVSGFTGDGPTQQQALYARLGTTVEFLDAVLDSGLFLNLHHADAKALMLGLLDVRIDVDGESKTIDEVDALYKSAFDTRKAAKVRAKSFSVPTMPTSPMPDGAQPPTVEAIEGQLGKLRGMLEALSGTAGQSAGRRSALQQALAKVQGYVPFQGELTPEETDRQIEVLEAEIAALESALEGVIPVAAAAPPKEDIGATLTFHRKAIGVLREHQPRQGCVLDAEVSCETAKIKFTNRAKALQDLVDAMVAGEAGQTPVAPPATVESPLKVARRRIQYLRSMKAHYDQSFIVERDRKLEEERLELEIAALPAETSAPEEIAVLKGRIQNGETLLQRSRQYWAALFAHQEGLKTQAKLAEEVAALEKRCEALGPNGHRALALATAIGLFETKINRFTEPFGWTLACVVDPWQVTANGAPVETYSESEQFLIGIAMQLAIAEVSGLSFAVVDRLDMLDVEHRGIATKMLLGCSLEQVFILATREPEQNLPAAKDGFIAHRLGTVDGASRILESVGL